VFQPRRSAPRPSPRSSPTIAVGQRVFVNCPGGRSGSVVLLDESGKIFSATHLADGVEVEVPFFQIGPHKVWGATAMVLSEFAAAITLNPDTTKELT